MLLVLLFGAATCGTARADGDPASDMLLGQNVFYPYLSHVPRELQQRLDAAVSATHRAHLPLKVALIAHRSDLGSISPLYGRPQRYARFLGIELSYDRRVSLLVVMPDGFGSVGLPAKLEHSVANARAPATTTAAGLAAAALSLISHLDSELDIGHVGRASASHAGPQTSTILLPALIIAAVVIGGLLIIVRIFFPPNAKSRDR